MGTIARRQDDWDECTRVNAEPATEFGADVSGQRPTLPERSELADLFDDEEAPGEQETRVRDVPSALIRAAAAGGLRATIPDMEQTVDLEKTKHDPQLVIETPLAIVPMELPRLAPPPVSTARPTARRVPYAGIAAAAMLVFLWAVAMFVIYRVLS